MERMRIADVEEDIDHELVSKEQIDAKIHEMAALASEDYRDKNPLPRCGAERGREYAGRVHPGHEHSCTDRLHEPVELWLGHSVER